MSIDGVVATEILEGPTAIRDTVSVSAEPAQVAGRELRRRGVRRVWLIGNGTSYHTALHAASYGRRIARPEDPVTVAMTAGDFLAFRPALAPDDVVIGVSASGEFRDVLGVFEDVRGRLATVGVVHVADSTLARLSDHLVVAGGGTSRAAVMTKTFSSTLAAAILLVASTVRDDAVGEASIGLLRAADHAERALELAEPVVEDIAAELRETEHIYVVGAGCAFAGALEAALKLKEIAIVHAEASETWEMASGPATIVGPASAVVSLSPFGAGKAATDDVVRHCRDWGATIVEVAEGRSVADSRLLEIPAGVDDRFAALSLVPPVALLAVALARLRGATPDRPTWTQRYMSQGLTHIVVA